MVRRAAAVASTLALSPEDLARLQRLVTVATAFDDEALPKRRALLETLTAELAGFAETEEAPAETGGPRIRSLNVDEARAPVPMQTDELHRSLGDLKGVGPAAQQRLAVRGLRTMGDVLLFLPRRYEDRRLVSSIATAVIGQTALIRAQVVSFQERFARKRMYELTLEDDTGTMLARWFGFRPGAFRSFLPGASVIISGDVREGRRHRIEMIHPDLEVGDTWDDDASFGRIIPVYTEVEGISARHFRRIAQRAVESSVDSIPDFLPESFQRGHELVGLSTALRSVHFPDQNAQLEELLRFGSPGQRRLVFDELFFVQLGLALKKRGVELEQGIPFRVDEQIRARAVGRLPFQLTGAQSRALEEIARDLARPTPMNRLLQGDVGSGKTAVALASALIAVENGYQAAVMAPTELLAEQHLRTFQKLLGEDLFDRKPGVTPIRTGLLSGGRRMRSLRARSASPSGHMRSSRKESSSRSSGSSLSTSSTASACSSAQG
jgi:ATP-dependent DNA helicase RecG